MTIAVYTLSAGGEEIGGRILALYGTDAVLFTKADYQSQSQSKSQSQGGLVSFVRERFQQYQAHIFIMAVGIVVRAVGPLVQSKWVDPAVIVIDDKGKFCISLLSGHMGGANRLTNKIAVAIGAVPVVTTATEVHGKISFDDIARKNNLYIENKEMVKTVATALLQEEKVSLHTAYPVFKQPAYISNSEQAACHVWISNEKNIPFYSKKTLILRPKNLIIGVGCKKDTDAGQLETYFWEFLNSWNKSIFSVQRLVSIDLKKEERAIVALAEKYGLPFTTVSVDYLQQAGADDTGSYSRFVKETVGIGSVAESCVRFFDQDIVVIAPKTKYPGVTFALGEMKTEIYLE